MPLRRHARHQVNPFRIALANLRFPATPEESVALAEQAIAQAAKERAGIICFPECFVPGYRAPGKPVPPPDAEFLERAWSTIAASRTRSNPPALALARAVFAGLRIGL